MGEELDKLTTTLSTMLDKQRGDLDRGIRSLADALRQAADRVAAYAPGAPQPAAAVATAGTAAAASAGGGILAVRVVNDLNTPVPVVMARAPQQERPGGGPWGAVSGIAGGIGNLIGGLLGGIVGGGVGGPFMVAGMTVLLPQLTKLVGRIDELLTRFYAFAHTFVEELRTLIRGVFDQLTAAGILPVSQLFASLLLFVDVGISVVLAHLGTVINWVEQVFGALVEWTGRFVNALGSWLSKYLAILLELARPYLDVITRDATRAALESLASLLFGISFALSEVIVAAVKYAAAWVLNDYATRKLGPLGAQLFPPPAPLGPDVRKALADGVAQGTKLSQTGIRLALGPPPSATPAPGAPATTPAIKMPRFTAPELTLADFPDITPQLHKLLTGQPPTPEPSTPTAKPPSPAPLTLNGGIHIQITTDAVDAEHTDETARRLARSMLDELRRLTERERFRAGLPTTAAP
ncbi:hypothetical protein ACWCQP_18130 [Streptomyces chartreusis]